MVSKTAAKSTTLRTVLSERLAHSILPGERPLDQAALDEAADFLLAAMARRAPGESLVEIASSTGDKRCLRIAVINDDMPFLVDSVSMAVNRTGRRI